MEVNKDSLELKNDLKRSSNEYIHSLIHEVHEASDGLLDDDLSNDSPTMKKLELQLGELFKAFNIRLNLR